MFISSVEIYGLYQYINGAFSFTPGINLIVGPNGVGKTNLLNALKFALVSWTPYKKKLCVNKACNESDVHVDLQFEHNNNLIYVSRWLVPAKTTCVTPISQSYGDKEVTSTILDVLGITETYLLNSVFTSQGALRNFIDSTPNERIKAIEQLLNLDAIENLWKNIGEFINVNSAIEKLDYGKELNELAIARTNLGLYKDIDEEYVVAQHKIFLEIESMSKVLKQLQGDVVQLEKRIEKLRDSLNIERPNWEKNEQYEKLLSLMPTLRSYELTKKELNYLFSGRSAPVKRIDENEKLIIQKKMIYNEQLIKLYYSAASFVQESGKCILCKQDVDPASLSKHLQTEISNRTIIAKDLDEKLKNVQSLIYARERYEKEKLCIKQLLKNLRATKKMLPEDIPTLAELEEYEANKIKYLHWEKQHARTITELQELEKKYQEKSAALKELNEKVHLKYTTLAMKPNVISKKMKELEEIQNIKQKIEILSRYEEMSAKLQEKKERLSVIREVRDIFHRNCLVSLLIKDITKMLSEKINLLLSLIDADYSVSIDNDMSITVNYAGGREINEKMLSYGEQLALALCYHLAMSELSNVQLLVLDEPTLGLDEHRVNKIPELILKFSEAMQGRIQIICCSHEKDLQRCADNIIELGGSNS